MSRLLKNFVFCQLNRSTSLLRNQLSSNVLRAENQQHVLLGQQRSASMLISCLNTNQTVGEGDCWFIQKRYKKKPAGKQVKTGTSKRREMEEKDEEDEDDDDDDDDDEAKEGDNDSQIMNTTTPSMQLVGLGKSIFNMSRQKFEESFFEGLLRVNGERVAKTYTVVMDDEIDLIRGINLEDRSKLEVNRVNILKVDDKAASSGRIRLTFRKSNKLIIENYKRDPYELN